MAISLLKMFQVTLEVIDVHLQAVRSSLGGERRKGGEGRGAICAGVGFGSRQPDAQKGVYKFVVRSNLTDRMTSCSISV